MTLPFSTSLLAILILILFACICLLGMRESSGIALAIMMLHIVTISTIAISAVVHWGRNGNSQLAENWRLAQPASAAEIGKQIFFGVSIGFLGNTGMMSRNGDNIQGLNWLQIMLKKSNQRLSQMFSGIFGSCL